MDLGPTEAWRHREVQSMAQDPGPWHLHVCSMSGKCRGSAELQTGSPHQLGDSQAAGFQGAPTTFAEALYYLYSFPNTL